MAKAAVISQREPFLSTQPEKKMTAEPKSTSNINFSVDQLDESNKTIEDFMGRSMQYNAKELLGRAEEAFKQIMTDGTLKPLK